MTITQWVEVRGDFCWYWWNCWPSLNELKVRGDFCWYWWNCWPSLNELRWEVIFVDIGGIVDHHSMSWSERWFLLILVELLTITQWVEVRGDFCWYWWNCWPSLNELKWEVIFVDIGGIVDHHSMSWGERWFLLILVELLTIIQWVEVRVIFVDIGVIIDITQWVDVRGDFCWYWWNCWPSLNELRWEVIFVDIGGIVDHHSMSWGERWFLLILVELLTITQWVEVKGVFCWYWWNCWPSLNELKWDMIFVDIGGIVDHHSMNLGERWFLLILVELLTITQWIEVRGIDWPFVDIGGIVDHHSMSWIEGWFLLILVVELLTITQWVEVRGDFQRWCLLILVELLTITQWVEVRGDVCWYWWNCWPSLNELRWEVIFVDIGGIVDHHSMWLRWEVIFVDIGGIVDHHSMSWSERWFLLILVELLTITQWVEVRRWFLLILVELLTITQWVEVRGDFCWYWWNCWPSLNEFRRGERWFLLILVELLTITQWVEVRGDFCWYWWNWPWPSLNELTITQYWGERWFLLILVELLTITQWVEVRGDFCWYWWNCWPSLNELRWEVIFVDIGWNCWPSFNELKWGVIFGWYWWNCWPSLNELRWEVIFDIGGWHLNEFRLILVELLTIIQWVEVRGDFCWYWWNCWHHSMSWCERWFLLILVELLTITQWVRWEVIFVDIGGIVDHHSMSWRWEVIFVDIGGIVDHHSMSWSEGWPSLNGWGEIGGIVDHHSMSLRWFFDIGGIVDHHSMSWSERWFLLILVELLTITQWVEVRGDFCWYWWNCWPSLNELMWEVIFVDIGGIAYHHWMS